MPKVSTLQSNFNGGEMSPLLHGRIEEPRYKQCLAKVENYIPLLEGPVTRAPGSRYVAATKHSNKKARLQAFEFSITQSYILEFGDQYLRFYTNGGQLLSGGVPYEIATPYLEADVMGLYFVQSADVLYIAHPNYAPRKLSRIAATNWTLTIPFWLDGPYLDLLAPAVATTTLVCSAATGSVTLTASSITDINGGVGFKSTDVGRLVRLNDGSNWSWGTITAFTDTTHVTFFVNQGNAPTVATKTYRMGAWSGTTGYPGCVTFHEDRLGFGGILPGSPLQFDLSNSSDYENFAPTALNGTVIDSSAISAKLNSSDVNAIRWMTSDEKGLAIGNAKSEGVVRPSSLGEALTPTNASYKQTTAWGSAAIQPVQMGKATIFAQRGAKRVREMAYFYTTDGYRAEDITELSQHITGDGITQMAFQRLPAPLVWMVRSDGQLLCLSYERDVNSLKVGWARRVLGDNRFLASGVDPDLWAAAYGSVVESVAVIPNSSGLNDDVWLIVKRYINGAYARYVEYFGAVFQNTDLLKDAFFVDAGLTLDAPLALTGVSGANPIVVTTVTPHGFSNGDSVQLDEIIGRMPAPGNTALNGSAFTIGGVTANTFTLVGVNGALYSPYVSGGVVRKRVTTISGLTHLEGQVVDILADGAPQNSKTVSGGAITLDAAAAVVQVGLGYRSDLQFLRNDAGAADGTALGKTRRGHRFALLLYKSLGLKVGKDFSNLTALTFNSTNDTMGVGPGLVGKIFSFEVQLDYDFDNMICIRQDQPLPSTILAASMQQVEQDR